MPLIQIQSPTHVFIKLCRLTKADLLSLTLGRTHEKLTAVNTDLNTGLIACRMLGRVAAMAEL